MKFRETTFLHCQACSNKFILDEHTVEIKRCDVPGGIPYVDKIDGKVKLPPMMPTRRMFKCTKCGRGVASKILTKPSRDPSIISERKGYVDPGNPRS